MSREKLLSVTKKDLEIHFFSGSGAGGQHRNKHQNCVRMRHPESGAMSTGQDGKSRKQNLKKAFTRLVTSDRFEKWLRIKITEKSDDYDRIKEKVEKIVGLMMNPKNIKVEYF